MSDRAIARKSSKEGKANEMCDFKSTRGKVCIYLVLHVGNHSWQEITEEYESGVQETDEGSSKRGLFSWISDKRFI